VGGLDVAQEAIGALGERRPELPQPAAQRARLGQRVVGGSLGPRHSALGVPPSLLLHLGRLAPGRGELPLGLLAGLGAHAGGLLAGGRTRGLGLGPRCGGLALKLLRGPAGAGEDLLGLLAGPLPRLSGLSATALGDLRGLRTRALAQGVRLGRRSLPLGVGLLSALLADLLGHRLRRGDDRLDLIGGRGGALRPRRILSGPRGPGRAGRAAGAHRAAIFSDGPAARRWALGRSGGPTAGGAPLPTADRRTDLSCLHEPGVDRGRRWALATPATPTAPDAVEGPARS
jgi:hypothetical protein